MEILDKNYFKQALFHTSFVWENRYDFNRIFTFKGNDIPNECKSFIYEEPISKLQFCLILRPREDFSKLSSKDVETLTHTNILGKETTATIYFGDIIFIPDHDEELVHDVIHFFKNYTTIIRKEKLKKLA
jgi:hypothetical protein